MHEEAAVPQGPASGGSLSSTCFSLTGGGPERDGWQPSSMDVLATARSVRPASSHATSSVGKVTGQGAPEPVKPVARVSPTNPSGVR